MSELKACPFCGGEAIYQKGSVDGLSVRYVGCFDCGAKTDDLFGGGILETEAIAEITKTWNTRPLEDALLARIAELEVDNAELKKNNEHMLDCIFEYETIAPDGQLGVSLLNMDNHIRSLEADNAELKRKLANAEQKQREAESMVERLIETGRILTQSANTWEFYEPIITQSQADKWNALVAEWQARNE